MRVLIIDDDRAHGETLSDLLNSRGHEAYYAHSLPEVDWLFELFRFPLVILDHDMPGLTGPQFAERLLVRDPELRAIVMSARDVRRELAQGDAELPFLSKPIDIDALLALIITIGGERTGTSLIRRLAFPLQRYRDDD